MLLSDCLVYVYYRTNSVGGDANSVVGVGDADGVGRDADSVGGDVDSAGGDADSYSPFRKRVQCGLSMQCGYASSSQGKSIL